VIGTITPPLKLIGSSLQGSDIGMHLVKGFPYILGLCGVHYRKHLKPLITEGSTWASPILNKISAEFIFPRNSKIS